MKVSFVQRLCTLLLLTALLLSTACIRSRVRITSEPPDATVHFKGAGEEMRRGETPVTIPFIWYWYYKVRVEKEGYEPVESIERFRTPPWFIFPLDFFAKIIPIPITDTRELHYTLTPVEEAP